MGVGNGLQDFPIHSVNSTVMINDPSSTPPPPSRSLCYALIEALRTQLFCHIYHHTIYSLSLYIYIRQLMALLSIVFNRSQLPCALTKALIAPFRIGMWQIYSMRYDTIRYNIIRYVVINISISLSVRFAQSVRRLKTSWRCVAYVTSLNGL